jgi:cyanophycin synthetase
MTHRGAQKRNSPRKSALAKAMLRKSAANGPAQGHKPASSAELSEALANRPKVDFLDPFMRHAAMQAKGISLCAFLVTLAAFQRGLKVTFHYERASVDPRFAKAKMQGHRGELFSISNGTRTHTFSRTLGDLTDPAANAIAEDKHLTKAALKRAGVRTPEGIVVDKSQTALVEKFLAQHPGKRFVVKPHDGSLGKDVHANLPSSDIIDAINSIPNSRVVVEVFVEGIEYRVYVVGDQVVACNQKVPPNVIGDGSNSIKKLIELKNAEREKNPRFFSSIIKEFEEISAHLGKESMSLDSVPSEGQRVLLLDKVSASGADRNDATLVMPGDLGEVAVAACKAIGISVCGLDVIVSQVGTRPQAYVLELNQRPIIGNQSFPIEGTYQFNPVAEAIIDYYFPETILDRTHPSLAYDFSPILSVLESAQITEVSLPVIGPDWRVLRFVETGIAANAMAKLIKTAARTAGVFVMSAPAAMGSVELCLAYGPNNWRAFMASIPAQFRTRLEKLAAEAT